MANATPSRTDAAPDRTPLACAILALVALALRLALIARSPVFVDRLFAPDDTYYTLAIARSLARGLGPSVDGTHLTSGFQPLLAFLVAPLLRAGLDSDAAFRAALAIGAVSDAATTWLSGNLAWRIGRTRAAAIATSAIWALSPAAIATSLNGLETSLAIACVIGALVAWDRGSVLGTGALLGLCLLARVDTVFFVVIVGVALLVRRGLQPTLRAIAGALFVVGPWWAYAWSRFGTLLPESGAAVREQALMYKAMGLVVRDQLAWASGAVVGPPLFDSTWLRQALGSGASGVGFAIGLVLVAAALAVVRRKRSADALRILAATAACLFLFYGLYLPATWFFRRYLAPIQLLTGIAAALAFAEVWRTRSEQPLRFRSVAAFAGVCLVAALFALVRFATTTPAMTVDQGHHGAKGYREPARQIVALAPPGAVIGSFQSGALGWFADGTGKRVVNLDGVVDGEAARAMRDHRIAAFARERGITHLADWKVNVDLFLTRSGDARIDRSALTVVGEAEPQGRDERFVLYAIRWP